MNEITSFHIHIKRTSKHFDTNETVKIYSLKKSYVNTNITKINLDNQSYLNQLYENNTRFFNISPIRESPLNQLSETETAVREIILSQHTFLTHTLGFLFSLLLPLRIFINNKSLSASIFIFARLIFLTIYFTFLFLLNLYVFCIFTRLFFVNLNVKFS